MTSFFREDLGVGAFGSCFKTIHPCTQEELVIKTFADNSLSALVDEATILK